MKRQRISVDTKNVKKLSASMAAKQKRLATNVKRAANDVLLNAEADAKALSPRDKGDLENSIHANKAEFNNHVVSGSIGSNLVYALRRHEEHIREGTWNKYERGVKYEGYYVNGRGEVTRAKPEVRGYMPGRKYLENAARINKDNWRREIAHAVSDTFKGGMKFD